MRFGEPFRTFKPNLEPPEPPDLPQKPNLEPTEPQKTEPNLEPNQVRPNTTKKYVHRHLITSNGDSRLLPST